jgi:nicotinate-nucleotide adenylyltransferase
MRLGIFGGTFNPIHAGHLRAAEEVREGLALDKVVFVPSALPPHKELEDDVPGRVRLAMVEASIRGNPGFEASSFEVERPGPSYSLFTIEHFRSIAGTTPYFILGQDAFNEISTWYSWERLFDLAHFAVMTRPGSASPRLPDILPVVHGRYRPAKGGYMGEGGNEIVFVEVTRFAVSSSQVRGLVRGGRSIRYLVADAAMDIIDSERIYL